MKREAPTKAKFQLLEARLGRLRAMGALESIWHLAANTAPRGDIGRDLSDEEIEKVIGWDGEPGELIAALVKYRWLDRIEGDDRLVVHDWDQHCENSVHWKLARSRRFFANGAAPKTSSLPNHRGDRDKADAWYEQNQTDSVGGGEPLVSSSRVAHEPLGSSSPSPSPSPSPEKRESALTASGSGNSGKTPAPDDLNDSEKELLRIWLRDTRPELQDQPQALINACLEYHRSHGNHRASWYSTVQTWVRKEGHFKAPPETGKRPKITETVARLEAKLDA